MSDLFFGGEENRRPAARFRTDPIAGFRDPGVAQAPLARVKADELGLKHGADLMRVSYRQAKRLGKRYQAGGAAALKHGNAGRRSSRARGRRTQEDPEAGAGEIQRRREDAVRAVEHLASEDQLKVHPETLRRWMLAEGLWSNARKRKAHRKRRERRAHFWELVQLDDSFHEWHQERGGKACLMNVVDDATSTVGIYMGEGETIWAAAPKTTRTIRLWL
jgi:hypothetical protein